MIHYLIHLGPTGFRNVSSRQALWRAIREHPLQKRNVIVITDKLGLPQRDAAELVGVSVRTYQRQKDTTPISNAASENIVSLAELYEEGLNAFDKDKEAFSTWLNAAIPALNNEKPVNLLSTTLGIDLVKEELLRIEYAVY